MKTISGIPAMMTKLKTGFAAVKTALAGISAPIIAVIAVIVLLVGAFVHLWNTNEDFRNNILGIWEQIKNTFSNLVQGIVDRINALGFDFQSFAEVLKFVRNVLSGTVNNYYNNDNSRTVNQTNNSPKTLTRLEIYR